MIKDSGERREFSSGAVRDINDSKGRCDLLPLDVVANITESKVIAAIYRYTEKGEYIWLRSALYEFCDMRSWDLQTMLLEVSKHFAEGAKKYGEYNWQKGIPTHCYIDSAVRHYLKWMRGDEDEPHDRAFVWNLLTCCWTCQHKPELNDYAPKEENNAEN